MQNIFCTAVKTSKTEKAPGVTAKQVDNLILFGNGRASLCFHSRSSLSTTERKGRLQNMRWLCFVAWLQLSPTSYTTHKPPDLSTLPTSNGKCFKANVKHYHNFDNIHLLSEWRILISRGILQVNDDDDDRNLKAYLGKETAGCKKFSSCGPSQLPLCKTQPGPTRMRECKWAWKEKCVFEK